MPNGGYVKENGITLCPNCHLRAEEFHSIGVAAEGYSPDELFLLINSNKEKVYEAAINIS